MNRKLFAEYIYIYISAKTLEKGGRANNALTSFVVPERGQR